MQINFALMHVWFATVFLSWFKLMIAVTKEWKKNTKNVECEEKNSSISRTEMNVIHYDANKFKLDRQFPIKNNRTLLVVRISLLVQVCRHFHDAIAPYDAGHIDCMKYLILL